jgi:hypothetical protein
MRTRQLIEGGRKKFDATTEMSSRRPGVGEAFNKISNVEAGASKYTAQCNGVNSLT